MITSNPAIQAAITQGLVSTPQIKAPIIGTGDGEDFGKQLLGALKEVNASQNDAQSKQEDLMSGHGSVEIQDVMIAMEKASSTMQLTMAVRNKMLDAYSEIEKLQV